MLLSLKPNTKSKPVIIILKLHKLSKLFVMGLMVTCTTKAKTQYNSAHQSIIG
ncbi:hypothetical protein CPS_3318 [Colwellia psychrerythraea 34H]|uniref:Uncharacterized protein n=1 Tax=Colwellia psychrerythraea (strain 34H / ATCC BAA-681) TaxID=167879 RepID=Q47YX6_COLP3|nr:hypothetical protein CPS_3318 [Colwellia psychrerythraea 34H]